MDKETLEAMKSCPTPWFLSDEAYDFWEELQEQQLLNRADY